MRFKRKKRYGYKPVCQRCLNKLWRKKGYQFERSLCKKLEALGYSADRIPTSGSGRVSLPDIIAYHPEKRLALGIEAKAVDASTHKTWTVYADQIVKAAKYLLRHYPSDVERKAGVCVKFLLGSRVKAPIISRLIPVSDGMNLKKIPNIVVDISSKSDMPELTQGTLSKRSRYIRKVRRKRRG